MGDTYTGQGLIFAGGHLGRFMQVTLDEIAIFSKALILEEVQSIYSFSSSVNLVDLNSLSDNLKGYWRMNEGSGESIIDNSGSGNDGYVEGGYSLGFRCTTNFPHFWGE